MAVKSVHAVREFSVGATQAAAPGVFGAAPHGHAHHIPSLMDGHGNGVEANGHHVGGAVAGAHASDRIELKCAEYLVGSGHVVSGHADGPG